MVEQSGRWLQHLGPGLITGAADDDPSGIATYSQAGAQFGYQLCWTMVLTYPLMVGIQLVSARIGWATGLGLSANIRRNFPRPVLYAIVAMLLVANTINVAADIAAMGEALRLVIGGSAHYYAIMFGVVCLILQVRLSYRDYVSYLKWLTLALLSYVGVVFTLQVPLRDVALGMILPNLTFTPEVITVIVAVFGTTISPYLFFWQAAQEVEEVKANPRANTRRLDPVASRQELRRIKIDTYIGMGFSNLIALFIIVSTGATLHGSGITQIETSAQAAEALRPIAGEFTFLLFSLGIIGTGLLAVPVLAGSAAYAVTEAFQWSGGMDFKLWEAREFYAIVAFATVGGVALNFTSVDPIKALFWSAVINGVIAVPIMAVMMVLASRPEVMGTFTLRRRLSVLGWLATLTMGAAVVAMFLV
jgi:NRAMP (natural resistance-associated macrophage protein)-like metal ion transporter